MDMYVISNFSFRIIDASFPEHFIKSVFSSPFLFFFVIFPLGNSIAPVNHDEIDEPKQKIRKLDYDKNLVN